MRVVLGQNSLGLHFEVHMSLNVTVTRYLKSYCQLQGFFDTGCELRQGSSSFIVSSQNVNTCVTIYISYVLVRTHKRRQKLLPITYSFHYKFDRYTFNFNLGISCRFIRKQGNISSAKELVNKRKKREERRGQGRGGRKGRKEERKEGS